MKKLVSLLLIFVLLASFVSCMGVSPKEFSCEGMTITLTDDFSEKSYEGYTTCYSSDDVAVFILKESFSLAPGVSELTLDQYAQAVYEANSSKSPDPIKKESGLTIMEHSFFNEEEEKTYGYCSVMFKGEDAFWLIQFACYEDDYDEKKPQFIDWAKSVTFDS